jgi:arylsulfatase
MNRRNLFLSSAKVALATALGNSWLCSVAQAQTTQPPVAGTAAAMPVDRTILPVPEPKPPTIDVLDARNAIPPGRFEVKAPPNAPNVLIVLLDDMGFGQSSAFGGPVNMPALERLASAGLRYNQFHTTALCSPTRTALLTGRNHHVNNMGGITEVATAFPGNTGVRPNAIAPLAETLRLNGYGTAAFGKYHEAPTWEISPVGPFDRWPTHSGFDKFYGSFGGETNQWAPLIYDGTVKVEPPHDDPDYNFMTDMSEQAIKWMRSVKTLAPDKPFFMYFAPGAVHAPHHVPKEWIGKYKGRFDAGWDRLREETLAKQIALGIVPQGTKLAPKPEAIKDWDSLSADEKRLFARQMEVFAGFGEYTDHEIGRLVQAIDDQGQLDNTLLLYIVGDNGASAEGGFNGLFNENSYFNGFSEPLELQLAHIDLLCGPMAYSHYAAGWAVAGDTPFTWTKQIASSYGGTRNPLVVHWPRGIKAKNEVRAQWHHVVDVAQTILEAAGLPEPKSVNGTKQIPMQGVSMFYSFGDAHASDRHLTQYFEIIGNRAIYHDGWLAGTVHKAPWELQPRSSLDNDKWELYDTRSDFSLVHDLAATNPAKLKEMQELFTRVAIENHVLPIDDRSIERLNAAVAGRPDLQ